MTDPIQLRRRVRWVLSTLPKNRRLGEAMIFDKLRPDFPELKADELHEALLWNESKGYVDLRFNADEDRREYCLTNEGWQKEGLA